MKNKKIKTYAILLILVLLISVAYALLSSNLIINGISKIDSIKWDVHFENVEETSNSTVSPAISPRAPKSSKLQEIGYDVTFDAPGQIYEFTVDVVNGGTIDAMIDSFISKIKVGNGQEEIINADKSNLPSYLVYNISYSDGVSIKNKHLLLSKHSEKLKISVGIKEDVTIEELKKADGEEVHLNIAINYKQTNGEEIPVRP